MRKTLIIGIALAFVLVSGGFFSAQANCGASLSSLSPCNWSLSFLSPCNWHFPSLCGLGCGSKEANSVSEKDAYRANATCQGAYARGSTTPGQMSTGGI
jgi:hypothetical protein